MMILKVGHEHENNFREGKATLAAGGQDVVSRGKMKIRYVAIAAAAATIFALSAKADEVPTVQVQLAPMPAAAPAYTWTGYYAGLNAGYGFSVGHNKATSFSPNDALAAAALQSGFGGGTNANPAGLHVSGAVAGIQGGYNWQTSPNWLVGLEGDFQWADVRGTSVSGFSLTGAPDTIQSSWRLKWFSSLRGRVGYLPMDRLVLFGTGGLAFGQVDQKVSLFDSTSGSASGGFSFSCILGTTPCFAGKNTEMVFGPTFGVGGEYALCGNLTVKAEYDLVAFIGNESVNTVATRTVTGNSASSFKTNFVNLYVHNVRVGLNYKF